LGLSSFGPPSLGSSSLGSSSLVEPKSISYGSPVRDSSSTPNCSS
jgi:hypothetical protein